MTNAPEAIQQLNRNNQKASPAAMYRARLLVILACLALSLEDEQQRDHQHQQDPCDDQQPIHVLPDKRILLLAA